MSIVYSTFNNFEKCGQDYKDVITLLFHFKSCGAVGKNGQNYFIPPGRLKKNLGK